MPARSKVVKNYQADLCRSPPHTKFSWIKIYGFESNYAQLWSQMSSNIRFGAIDPLATSPSSDLVFEAVNFGNYSPQVLDH